MLDVDVVKCETLYICKCHYSTRALVIVCLQREFQVEICVPIYLIASFHCHLASNLVTGTAIPIFHCVVQHIVFSKNGCKIHFILHVL